MFFEKYEKFMSDFLHVSRKMFSKENDSALLDL